MFAAMRQSFGDEFVNNIGQPNGTTLKFIDSQGRIYGVNRNPENAQTFAKGSLKPKINEDAHQAGTQNASQKGQLSAPGQRSKPQTPTRKIK